MKPKRIPSSHTMRIDILGKTEETVRTAPQELTIPHSHLPGPSSDTEVAPLLPQEPGFHELFQRVYDGAVITDLDGRIMDANARALEFLGYAKQAICSLCILDIASGFDASLIQTLLRNLENDRFTLIQAYCVRRDRTIFPSEIAVSLLHLSGRTCLCFFVRDITLRIQAEESLRKERNLLRTLIDNLPDFIYVKDTTSRFLIGNKSVADFMGAETPDQLVERSDFDYYPLDLASLYHGDEKDVVTRGTAILNKEEPSIDRDGKPRLLLTTKVPLKDESGRTIGIVGIGRDITDQRVIDNQRLHAQKMESIGQLAAGIAHEINTPVQYIGDNIRFLNDSFRELVALLKTYEQATQAPSPPEAQTIIQAAREKADIEYLSKEIPSAIEQSLEGVNRVTKIVYAMKEFSHPDAQEKTPANLNKAIESTVTVSRNEWKYVADLTMELDPDLPPVPCHIGHLNQVILNLIVNAAHAIADVVGDGSQTKGQIKVSTHRDGDTAEIRVSDTGTGIPVAIRHRIFEPFFTTKQVGKGTGQGLSTCHSIVTRKHGGTISFETEEGKGTTFLIRLPLQDTGAQV